MSGKRASDHNNLQSNLIEQGRAVIQTPTRSSRSVQKALLEEHKSSSPTTDQSADTTKTKSSDSAESSTISAHSEHQSDSPDSHFSSFTTSNDERIEDLRNTLRLQTQELISTKEKLDSIALSFKEYRVKYSDKETDWNDKYAELELKYNSLIQDNSFLQLESSRLSNQTQAGHEKIQKLEISNIKLDEQNSEIVKDNSQLLSELRVLKLASDQENSKLVNVIVALKDEHKRALLEVQTYAEELYQKKEDSLLKRHTKAIKQ